MGHSLQYGTPPPPLPPCSLLIWTYIKVEALSMYVVFEKWGPFKNICTYNGAS